MIDLQYKLSFDVTLAREYDDLVNDKVVFVRQLLLQAQYSRPIVEPNSCKRAPKLIKF